MVSYDITFKEQRASHHGLLVVRRPDIPIPTKQVETTAIAGRDGVLVSDISRYEPIEIEVTFNFLTSPEKWNEHLRMVKAWAQGRGRLSMSDDETYYYKVLYTKTDIAERTSRKIGTLGVVFVCDPYQYRKDGDIAYTPEQCAFNGYDVCHPAYIIEGDGTCTLTVNGNSVQVSVDDKVTIDSDLMIAFDADGSVANTSTIGNYEGLYLQPGDNEIQITDSFTLSIIPRWRHI
jgi:predicted phage tail component-like protein